MEISSLLNRRLTIAISFHDTLHGFRTRQGSGTAALEAKLFQQLTSMKEAVLFKVSLDIYKAYNALDWEMDSVGPSTSKEVELSWY